MSNEKRLTIPSGTDAFPIFRLKNRKTGDPVDLTLMKKIIVQFTAKDRSMMNFITKDIAAIKATSEYQGVNYSAVSAGIGGNAIDLSFDGVKSIATVIAAWNANPDNASAQVESDADDDTVVPPKGDVSLEGGYDHYSQVAVYGNPVLGKIQIILTKSDTQNLRVGNNQTMKIFVDFGDADTRRGGSYQSLVDVTD